MTDVEERENHTRELLVYSAPCLVAFVTWWLPLFRVAPPEDATYVLPESEYTLLGLALEPGETGPTTTITVLALLVAALLAACVATSLASVGRTGGALVAAVPLLAGAALFAGFALIMVVGPNDGSGNLGNDQRQLGGAAWLLAIIPVWFLVACFRERPDW